MLLLLDICLFFEALAAVETVGESQEDVIPVDVVETLMYGNA